MHGAHEFLKALAIVLGVAAVTTVLFQRLRQPVVLGYILAGLIVGPHLPVPLVAERAIVQTLSQLGVILLMFSLGLEFSPRKLAEVGPTAGLTAIIESSIMLWLGFLTARALGFSTLVSVFAGAIVAISSTTIIAKAFQELGVRGRLRELVVGVLIVEDLIAILLMAALTALASGSGLSTRALVWTTARLVLFLAALLAAGMLVVPRAMRAIRRLNRSETTLVASLGLCFGISLLAYELGYSVALGAFIAGSLVAESGEQRQVEQLVQPVRDMFAAIFFVSVGMLIDPAVAARQWSTIAVFTALVLLGKIFGVAIGAFLTGSGTRTSIQAGMSLAQIGEFSFIIAGLGMSLGATGESLYTIAVAVSALTTLSTPWLIRASIPVASFVDRKLPRPLQTVAALYGSWVEQIRESPKRRTLGGRVRRLVRVLVIDAALLTALAIGTSLVLGRVAGWIAASLDLDPKLARAGVVATAALIASPICAGLVRNSRRMGVTLATAAMPAKRKATVDLAAAPRRVLVVTLQLFTTILVGLPILTVTQPFLPGVPGAAIFAGLLVVLGVAFWRSAAELQGHVRAGAQVIVEALARQSGRREQGGTDELARMRDVLPGLGEPVAFRIPGGSPVVGRSLAALNLRGLTGATVLAIWRSDGSVMVPAATEVLREGDVLALAGTHESVEAARGLLCATPQESRAATLG